MRIKGWRAHSGFWLKGAWGFAWQQFTVAMQTSPPSRHARKMRTIRWGMVVLILLGFGELGRLELWAAPELSPNRQTVPTRTPVRPSPTPGEPTSTPVPPPPPGPEVSPTPTLERIASPTYTLTPALPRATPSQTMAPAKISPTATSAIPSPSPTLGPSPTVMETPVIPVPPSTGTPESSEPPPAATSTPESHAIHVPASRSGLSPWFIMGISLVGLGILLLVISRRRLDG